VKAYIIISVYIAGLLELSCIQGTGSKRSTAHISNPLLNQQGTSDSSEIKIIEKPLNYSKRRETLSLEYLKKRHNIKQNFPFIKPVMIVLHYTEGGTIKSIYDYFNKDEIEPARKFNRDKSLLNVSSHYVIDRDGIVYHLIADTLFARHIIGLNYCSIGIENIGSKKEPLTDQQVIANAKLIRHLCKKNKIKFLIGHSEYSAFRNSALWKENDPHYYTIKDDPGIDFLAKVRELISDINLKRNPE